MSNYSKTTDFAAKDSLPSGDSGKIIRGSEFETEFDAISTAIATKADAASPTFTGTVTIDGLTVNGNTTLGNAATDTVTVTADIASNLIPSADDTYDLGASGAEWNDLYVDGVAYIDTVAGFATTENITFGDGDRAIFGASSDLQIYHSGTASHITENGSGSLFIDGTNLRLRSSTEEIYLEALADGAVTLYHDNASKFATTATGIDVTGTVTADEVDLSVKAVIGGATPRIEFFENDTTDLNARIRNTGGTFQIQSTDDAGTTSKSRIVVDHATGDISFREDTGTTAKLFWDASAESLGIGTSSPSRSLHINSGTVNVVAKFESSDSIAAVEFVDSDTTTNPNMGAVGDDLRFVTNNAEAMRIDSSGLVGIGTDSPSHKLDVNGNAQISAATGSGTLNLVSSENVLNAGQKIAFFGANRSTANEENAYIKSLMTSNSGGAGNVQLGHLTFGTSGSERVRIDSDGNVGIGTDSPSSNLHVREGSTSNLPTINIATKGVLESTAAATAFCGLSIISGATSGASILNFGDSDDEDVGRLLYAHSDNSLRINTSASEAMRITSDGNLLVAKTAASTTNTVGHELDSDGHAEHITDGVAALMLNRKSTDGVLIELRKDNAVVGSIGTIGGEIYIESGDVGLQFDASGNDIVPYGGGYQDAAIDLGASGVRFKDLYLSGGAYLGGTAAANKLDDYEEGTWTPVLSDGTNTVTLSDGTYTKVGRVVTCVVSDFNEDTSSLSGNVKLTGLPFTSSGKDQGVPLYYRDGGTAGESVIGFIAQTTNQMQIRENRGTALTAVNISATATTTIISTFSYQTA